MSFGIFSLFGLGGTTIVILAILYSSIIYRGKRGERFSLANHFISELGEVGISRGAWAFNSGLILGGLCLLPFVIWLGTLFHSILGWLGMAAGIVAGLGVAAVGIFPMNNLKPHGHAAMTFFRGGLVMVIFFGLAILFQPAGQTVVPKWANILSILAVGAYTSFLSLLTGPKKDKQQWDSLDPEKEPDRPHFWLTPFLEWLVFFTTIFWLFGMAFLI
jgi:hypothetical membrane protein